METVFASCGFTNHLIIAIYFDDCLQISGNIARLKFPEHTEPIYRASLRVEP